MGVTRVHKTQECVSAALPLSPAPSLQPPASGHLEKHSKDRTAGLRSSWKQGHRAPWSRDTPEPTPSEPLYHISQTVGKEPLYEIK